MRLIDADALESNGILFETHGGATFIALGSVRTAPTIDAVPVVRCKDCKHFFDYEADEPRYGQCKLISMDMDITRDDFCSYGERRDGDDGKEKT